MGVLLSSSSSRRARARRQAWRRPEVPGERVGAGAGAGVGVCVYTHAGIPVWCVTRATHTQTDSVRSEQGREGKQGKAPWAALRLLPRRGGGASESPVHQFVHGPHSAPGCTSMRGRARVMMPAALGALAAALCCPAVVDAYAPAAGLSSAGGRGPASAPRGGSRALCHRRAWWSATPRAVVTPRPPGLRAAADGGADDGDDAEWETVDYGATLSVLSLTCVSGSAPQASFGMDVEVLTELLMENGALSVVVEDADYGTERERPIFDEPAKEQTEGWFRVPSAASGDNFWSNCNVTAYFTKDFDIPV